MVSLRIGMSWRRIGALPLLAVLSLVAITDAGAQGSNPPGVDPVVFRLAKANSHLDPGDYNVTRPLTAMITMLRDRAQLPDADGWERSIPASLAEGDTGGAIDLIADSYAAGGPRLYRTDMARSEAALHLGALALLEDHGKARGYFDQARRINPRLGEAWVQSARLAGLLENPAAGLAIAQQGLKALGHNAAPDHLARLNMLIAEWLIKTRSGKDTEQAAAAKVALESALNLARKIPDKHLTAQVYYQLALWELHAGNANNAIPLIDSGISLSMQDSAQQGHPLGLTLKGNLHLLAGERAKAEELLELAGDMHQARGQRAAYARNRGYAALAYVQNGQLKKAQDAIRQAADIYKALGRTVDQAGNLSALAELANGTGKTAKACEHWKDTRRLYHRARLPHLVKKLGDRMGAEGCMLGATGGLIGSLADRRTKGAEPYLPRLISEVGEEEASNILQEADHIGLQALYLLNKNTPESALQAAGQAQEALDLNPQSLTGWYGLGTALSRLDLPVDALSALQNAHDTPLDLISQLGRPRIALLHGRVLEELGRWQEAYDTMELGLRKTRSEGDFITTNLYIDQARIAENLGGTDEAVQLTRHAISSNIAGDRSDQNGHLFYKIGWISRNRRDYDQAAEAFGKAAQLISDPDDMVWRATAHYYAASANDALGRTATACVGWLAAARDFRTANREESAEAAERRREARNCPPPAPAPTRATIPAADKG